MSSSSTAASNCTEFSGRVRNLAAPRDLATPSYTAAVASATTTTGRSGYRIFSSASVCGPEKAGGRHASTTSSTFSTPASRRAPSSSPASSSSSSAGNILVRRSRETGSSSITTTRPEVSPVWAASAPAPTSSRSSVFHRHRTVSTIRRGAARRA